MKNEEKITCHDCEKTLEKGSEFMRFSQSNSEIDMFKCKDCFEVSPTL